MEILNQPFSGQLGDRLIECLDSPTYQSLNVIVAFAKNSGVLRIKDALERFRKRGSKVNVYVGIDLGGTSYEALTTLLSNVDSLNVVHSEKSQTFHSKIYNFVGKNENLIIVGSHNLTGGGLWTNFESSVLLPIDKSVKSEMDLQNKVDEYIGDLSSLGASFMKINDQDQIDELFEHGYVLKEVFGRVSRRNINALKNKSDQLFGKGTPVQLPSFTAPSPPASSPVPKLHSAPDGDESPTLWYATQKMTGGSANQIDLSKTSLIAKGDPQGTPYETQDPSFMRGSVEFFGVDPNNQSTVTEITINYDGEDYFENKIRLHQGSRNPNGTWRLQLQGVDPSGRTINEAFKAKGGSQYLKQKIVTFTKLQDNYYFMSVLLEAELDSFKEASQIWGYNGRQNTGRPIGIL